MSSTVENQVFEAELITEDSFNPYQAPGPSHRAVVIRSGLGRATEKEINNANLGMIAAEITFVSTCVLQLAATMAGFGAAQSFGFWLPAWLCFGWMVLSSEKVDLVSLAAVVLFPIPLFGSLLFFLFKQRANRFLIWNGQRPGFLGATPDAEEIRLMNEDCNYRPTIVYQVNGSKRRLAWSLTDWFFITLVSTVVFAIAIPWTLF